MGVCFQGVFRWENMVIWQGGISTAIAFGPGMAFALVILVLI